MRLLRAKLNWGLGPQTPRIYRFFPARMEVFEFIQGTGPTCPPPFRPLSRSLGLLPSMALSSPAQVLPEWTTSTSSCNTFSANGDYPLNFVPHSRGSLQLQARPCPAFGRPVHLRGSPLDYGPVLLLMPFEFHLAVDTLPSGVPLSGGFRSVLICFRLSPLCPFRRRHTFYSPASDALLPLLDTALLIRALEGLEPSR